MLETLKKALSISPTNVETNRFETPDGHVVRVVRDPHSRTAEIQITGPDGTTVRFALKATSSGEGFELTGGTIANLVGESRSLTGGELNDIWTNSANGLRSAGIPVVYSESNEGEKSTPEDILSDDDTKVNDTTSGGVTIAERPGGLKEAEDEFDNLEGNEVTTDGNKDKGVRVKELSDGRKAIVRGESSDGRPTLEIHKPNTKGKQKIKMKIRYGTGQQSK